MAKRYQLARAGAPPVQGLCPPVRVLDPDLPISAFICSTEIFAIWTHWDPRIRRTVACTEGAGSLCQGHLQQLPMRWKGYLHLFGMRTKAEFFLELTPLGAKHFNSTVTGLPGIRGLHMEFRREYRTKKSSIITAVTGEWVGPGDLPKPKTPELSLTRIFGLDEID